MLASVPPPVQRCQGSNHDDHGKNHGPRSSFSIAATATSRIGNEILVSKHGIHRDALNMDGGAAATEHSAAM